MNGLEPFYGLTPSMNSVSLAYTLAALCYLCPEAERYARKLNLDTPSLCDRRNFLFSIGGEKERLLGYIRTTNYVFSFREDGRLHSVDEINSERYYSRTFQQALAHQRCEMDTKDARDLALKWLDAVDVDTNRLSRECDCRVRQPDLGNGHSNQPVPEFFITWTKRSALDSKAKGFQMYAAHVDILGPGARLTTLEVEDMSLSRKRSVRIPGESILMQLPNEPFTNIFASRELSVSNVYDVLHTSTTYQAIALSNMLAAADWTVHQLSIPESVRPNQLLDAFVAPPAFGLRGCLETEHCFFQFDEFGDLSYFLYYPNGHLGVSDRDSRSYYEGMSLLPSLVDSNSVVRLAKQWLRALDIDVEKLEQAGAPVVSRYKFARNKVSHIWWVTWWNRDGGKCFAIVQVDGTRKSPDRIKILDRRFCLRASPKVENASALMAIPDPELQRDPLRAHLNVWPQLFPSNAP